MGSCISLSIINNFAYFTYAAAEAAIDADVPIDRDSSVIHPSDVKRRI